jgi:uroporphyrinogen decarboxylase
MTLRQNVLSALHYQEPTPLPYTLPIEESVAQRLDTHYGSTDWRQQIHNAIALVTIPTLGVREGSGSNYTDPFGNIWRTDQRPYHLEKPALTDPDLSLYHWPAIQQLWDQDAIQSQIQAAQQRGQFVVVSTGFGLFERSWTLRGFENALTDMLLHPTFYHELLDGILEIHLQLIERLVKLPIDGILLSDDWGEQRGVIMGPRLWRKFIQPRAARYNNAVHAGSKWTFQHCCGNVMDIIPEMITSGLDVLESLQPEAMDVYEIKRRFGKDLRLWGGLGTQRMIPYGTPDEISQEVSRLKAELGAGGGYILAPAKPLLQEVPTQNAAAVVEAFTASG